MSRDGTIPSRRSRVVHARDNALDVRVQREDGTSFSVRDVGIGHAPHTITSVPGELPRGRVATDAEVTLARLLARPTMAEPTRRSGLDADPPIIAHLRTKTAHEHDLPGADRKALFATLVGRSMRSLGVRPTVLEHREDGTKVYGLTREQSVRVVERYNRLREESADV